MRACTYVEHFTVASCAFATAGWLFKAAGILGRCSWLVTREQGSDPCVDSCLRPRSCPYTSLRSHIKHFMAAICARTCKALPGSARL